MRPKMVAALDEVSLETTEYDVAYQEDMIRLLHYKRRTEKQHRTPLVISYAIVNRYHILDIHPERQLGNATFWIRGLTCT